MTGKKSARSQEAARMLCRRWTRPRDEIINLLLHRRRQHLTAMEIYVQLRSAGHDVGIATIYRTLELLGRAGLLRKIQCREGRVRYQFAPSDQSGRQCHLICTVCGEITSFRDFEREELDLADTTAERLEHKSGFLIRDCNFEYFGLCRKCRPDGRRAPAEKSRANLYRTKTSQSKERGPSP